MTVTKRVVSLLPSATEILCAVGGTKMLVGRSHEDDYPKEITHLPILTAARTTFTTSADVNNQVVSQLEEGRSLYTLHKDVLEGLCPDVILTQSLCEVCAIDVGTVHRVAADMKPSPMVVTLNPLCLNDVLGDLEIVGAAIGVEPEEIQRRRKSFELRVARATQIAVEEKIKRGFNPTESSAGSPNVLFMEWTDPIYPGGHWTPEIVHLAGGWHPVNPPKGVGSGAGYSHAVPAKKVIETAPEWLFVCPCGLNLEESRREWEKLAAGDVQEGKYWDELVQTSLAKNGKKPRVIIVDGNQMFNRPGPRLVDCLEFLVGVLWDRPDVIPPDYPFEEWKY
ncbi:hypothetical protein BJ742DRAFT_849377 [Cladochytrium replicatum]|nr:hypothetical protein BJ742DRAFT_849377 [Cladochytrium replicatum]